MDRIEAQQRVDKANPSRRSMLFGGAAVMAASGLAGSIVTRAQAQQRSPAPPTAGATRRPNILIIWGDDIGYWNPSAYHRGMMGYQTPNIDRLAREGLLFTDHYGQQSCTAGRAAFITGQSPFRTGPTIAELLSLWGTQTNPQSSASRFRPEARFRRDDVLAF